MQQFTQANILLRIEAIHSKLGAPLIAVFLLAVFLQEPMFLPRNLAKVASIKGYFSGFRLTVCFPEIPDLHIPQ